MAKVLKNTTGSAILLDGVGQEIPASGQITIAEVDYLKLASADSVSQLDPLITSGDVVVNDGTEDLSVTLGKAFIRYSDQTDRIKFVLVNDGFRASVKSIDDAFQDIRRHRVDTPQEITTSLNGTTNLDSTSHTFQIIKGSATGHSIVLPSALTIPVGNSYDLYNESSESVTIKNNAGTTLFTLNASSLAIVRLEDDGSAAGTWIVSVQSTTAAGIVSYVLTSNTLFITSSSTDDLITGFSTTPVSGRYAIFFSSDLTISNNNRIATCTAYVGGVAETNTKREVQGVSSNFSANFQTIGEVSVDGTEAVDIRVSITSNSLTIGQRSLVLIRLGSV